ncbi:MAG: Crp/Fnr family transcriptional regulator [Clostridiales bacterium]|nr:Crp/Fnr family transcriptional regulator [Clostridiales bacterium]
MLSKAELETVSKTFLFRGISPDEIKDLIGDINFEKIRFSKGEVIFSRENFRRALGIILSGSVTVTKGDLTMSVLSVSDLFGAAALFNEEETYVSTLTARKAVKVLFLSDDDVVKLIGREPRIAGSYIRYLSGRIRFLSEKVDILSEASGERRLVRFLFGCADENGVVTLGIPMTELASRLGIGRATLYRELSRLEKDGTISRDGKRIVIHEINGLMYRK